LSGQGDAEPVNFPGSEAEDNPDFASLFAAEDQSPDSGDAAGSRDGFADITQLEENPKPFFKSKDYYKKALMNVGDSSKKLHVILSQFLSAKDPQDRSLHRGRLMPAYWGLASDIARQIQNNLPLEKRLLLRFGVLSPTFISDGQKDMLSRIIFKNNTGEPVHYVDDWLALVASGTASTSDTDEVKAVKQDTAQRKLNAIEKKRGQRQGEISLLRGKLDEMARIEALIASNVKGLMSRPQRAGDDGLRESYSTEQKKLLTELPEMARKLLALDREVVKSYGGLDQLTEAIENLTGQVDGEAVSSVDAGIIGGEYNTIRQMAKLCVGRQGNHFPILMKQYFREDLSEISTRENVIREMAALEALDQDLFKRTFKGQTNRIVPHVLLIPCYGEQGICWQPFERHRRATSRARIAIPLFSKSVRDAVVTAMGDLRWQVAKERAQHYWMEEGITGRYYQWFQANKMKGDVKDAFIRDYALWVSKESQGTQKLDREIRGIFWRLIPFPRSVKESLKNRGFVYDELYKKDINISRSDGY
jgi:hypothetical protein